MINYIEKGEGLHKLISDSGYSLWHTDGVAYSDNDIEVQKIIDGYDPLPDSKTKKKAELVKDSEELLNTVILSKYPRFEVDTWQNQKDDANAYLANNNAVTITLDALASQRGVNKLDAANKILEKASQFASYSAMYAGERQRLEDLVDLAVTVEAVESIKFEAI